MPDLTNPPVYYVNVGSFQVARIDAKNNVVILSEETPVPTPPEFKASDILPDIDAINEQLTSFELTYKPDVILTYNGRIVDPLWDMFNPPLADE